jgi:hypothetical protein
MLTTFGARATPLAGWPDQRGISELSSTPWARLAPALAASAGELFMLRSGAKMTGVSYRSI